MHQKYLPAENFSHTWIDNWKHSLQKILELFDQARFKVLSNNWWWLWNTKVGDLAEIRQQLPSNLVLQTCDLQLDRNCAKISLFENGIEDVKN